MWLSNFHRLSGLTCTGLITGPARGLAATDTAAASPALLAASWGVPGGAVCFGSHGGLGLPLRPALMFALSGHQAPLFALHAPNCGLIKRLGPQPDRKRWGGQLYLL